MPVLSARQAAWLLRKHVARLTDQERACRAALEQQCPVLRNARELGDRLVAILHARDHDAVRAPRCCRWCNGQAEEQVQRLRGIKRSMFGSAGFALFRACIICAE